MYKDIEYIKKLLYLVGKLQKIEKKRQTEYISWKKKDRVNMYWIRKKYPYEKE